MRIHLRQALSEAARAEARVDVLESLVERLVEEGALPMPTVHQFRQEFEQIGVALTNVVHAVYECTGRLNELVREYPSVEELVTDMPPPRENEEEEEEGEDATQATEGGGERERQDL